MNFTIFSFSFQQLSIQQLGELQIDPQIFTATLAKIKANTKVAEALAVCTCNRVTFFFIHHQSTISFEDFFTTAYPHLSQQTFSALCRVYKAEQAIEHLLRLVCSLESMVIGEREILTQVRNSFYQAQEKKIAGHYLRILILEAINFAKKIFIETTIAKKEVSVSSVAFRCYQELGLASKATKILAIGAGQTNQSFLKFFRQHVNIHIDLYNRTLSKATAITKWLPLQAHALDQLKTQKHNVDLLLICTGTQFFDLLKFEQTFAIPPKIIVDLAVPSDIQAEILEKYPSIIYIGMERVKSKIEENLSSRKEAIPIIENKIKQKINVLLAQIEERNKINDFTYLPTLFAKKRTQLLNNKYEDTLHTMDPPTQELIQKLIVELEQKYIDTVIQIVKNQQTLIN